MRVRRPRSPSAGRRGDRFARGIVVEFLRLLVVVFGAGIGHTLGRGLAPTGSVLGPFDGTAVGVLVGSGAGYVLGGILGRSTLTTVESTTTRLRDVSAEALVAGGAGAAGGAVVGGALAWPAFLVPNPFLSVPLFCFVVVVLGAVGHRLALARKRDVVAIVGTRGGLTPRATPTAARDRVVDTSVAIDGRVLDVVRAGFLAGRLVVPSPVLAELQGLADAGDPVRRGRGRRGLATLEALQREPDVELEVLDVDLPAIPEVDAKLVRLCLDSRWSLLTLDTNLARAAALAGVAVMNLHALGLALRPPVLAGDEVAVVLLKPGREAGQAVGYLDDGTMVVVERARGSVGEERLVRVTSVLTTANGRMVFAEPAGPAAAATPTVPEVVPDVVPAAARQAGPGRATPADVARAVAR